MELLDDIACIHRANVANMRPYDLTSISPRNEVQVHVHTTKGNHRII
jgi:hypothetical protein